MALAFVLASAYSAKETIEKRALVKVYGNGKPPKWAEKQNEVLVLFAEHLEDVDPDTTAEYLGVERKPELGDLVEAD